MKTFEQFESMDEIKFLELAHLDELEVKFDFIFNKIYIFYFYKENCLFYQNKKGKYFWINYERICSYFEHKKNIISNIVNKYFNLTGYTNYCSLTKNIYKIENNFNIVNL